MKNNTACNSCGKAGQEKAHLALTGLMLVSSRPPNASRRVRGIRIASHHEIHRATTAFSCTTAPHSEMIAKTLGCFSNRGRVYQQLPQRVMLAVLKLEDFRSGREKDAVESEVDRPCLRKANARVLGIVAMRRGFAFCKDDRRMVHFAVRSLDELLLLQ